MRRVSVRVFGVKWPLAWASHISHGSPNVAPARCVTPASAAATMSRSTRSAARRASTEHVSAHARPLPARLGVAQDWQPLPIERKPTPRNRPDQGNCRTPNGIRTPVATLRGR